MLDAETRGWGGVVGGLPLIFPPVLVALIPKTGCDEIMLLSVQTRPVNGGCSSSEALSNDAF